MASRTECEKALRRLAESLAAADPATRERASFDRTLSCRLRDLDAAYAAQLVDGRLTGIREIDVAQAGEAHIKLTMSSDDLLALVAGELPLAPAWASGRVKVEAGIRDLLRLRSIF